MGRSIFVSYKHSDESVYDGNKTVRTYVDELEDLLEEEDHIYKGEHDDEDLSGLVDDTIQKKLADKMFYSTVTIVMISPNMKDSKPERDQWIPWEVSYSLKTEKRQGGRSNPNAVLAVTLPDINNSYDYYMQKNYCTHCNCVLLKTNTLFTILKNNMFNIKDPDRTDCPHHNGYTYNGDSSYILSVTWHDFKSDLNKYIDTASSIKDNIDNYDIVTEL